MSKTGNILKNIGNKLFILLVIIFFIYLFKNDFNFGVTVKYATGRVIFVALAVTGIICEIVGNAITKVSCSNKQDN